MQKMIRHGDMGLVKVRKKDFPARVKKSDDRVLMIGSGGNDHAFDCGTFYPYSKNGFVIGYFHAKNTTLFHPDHGEKIGRKKLREFRLKDGYYEVRKQNEETHQGMRPVID